MRIPPKHSNDSEKGYTVIGVYARIVANDRSGIESALEAIDGVSTFDLEHPGKIGILIEANSLAEGRDILDSRIRSIPGVLATWPVFSGQDPDDLKSTNHENNKESIYEDQTDPS